MRTKTVNLKKKEMDTEEYLRSIFIKIKQLSKDCNKTKKGIDKMRDNISKFSNGISTNNSNKL